MAAYGALILGFTVISLENSACVEGLEQLQIVQRLETFEL